MSEGEQILPYVLSNEKLSKVKNLDAQLKTLQSQIDALSQQREEVEGAYSAATRQLKEDVNLSNFATPFEKTAWSESLARSYEFDERLTAYARNLAKIAFIDELLRVEGTPFLAISPVDTRHPDFYKFKFGVSTGAGLQATMRPSGEVSSFELGVVASPDPNESMGYGAWSTSASDLLNIYVDDNVSINSPRHEYRHWRRYLGSQPVAAVINRIISREDQLGIELSESELAEMRDGMPVSKV